MRRYAAAFAVAIVTICLPLTASAKQWPSKPIHAVVPFAAGSTIDVLGPSAPPETRPCRAYRHGRGRTG